MPIVIKVKRVSLILYSLLFWACSFLNQAQAVTGSRLHLGSLSVKTSIQNKEAKKNIELGMKYLHLFMYDAAEDAFFRAQNIEPSAAMAYYGELMSQKHVLWQYENLEKAQAIIKRSKKSINLSKLHPIEKVYLYSAYLLFEQGKSSKERLNQSLSYLTLKQSLFKEEVELKLLLLLLKLAYVSEFPSDPKSRKMMSKGREEIDKLYQHYPKHPGAIHYHLHYFDSQNPSIAMNALKSASAALNYLSSSSHLTHMSAHIYRRLGQWKSFLEANERSIKASDNLCSKKYPGMNKAKRMLALICDADNRYHALEWLHYGAIKNSDLILGEKALSRMKHDANLVNRDDFYGWLYRMWARQFFAVKQFDMPSIEIKPLTKKNKNTYWSAYSECGALLVKGMLNLNKKIPVVKELNRMELVVRLSKKLSDPYVYSACQLNNSLLHAFKSMQEGKMKASGKYLLKASVFEQKLISTEATPSLPFVRVVDFKRIFIQ